MVVTPTAKTAEVSKDLNPPPGDTRKKEGGRSNLPSNDEKPPLLLDIKIAKVAKGLKDGSSLDVKKTRLLARTLPLWTGNQNTTRRRKRKRNHHLPLPKTR